MRIARRQRFVRVRGTTLDVKQAIGGLSIRSKLTTRDSRGPFQSVRLGYSARFLPRENGQERPIVSGVRVRPKHTSSRGSHDSKYDTSRFPSLRPLTAGVMRDAPSESVTPFLTRSGKFMECVLNSGRECSTRSGSIYESGDRSGQVTWLPELQPKYQTSFKDGTPLLESLECIRRVVWVKIGA